MLASLLILAASLALFVYWFRHSCLLLLRHHGVQASAAQPIHLTEVSQQLPGDSDLDRLDRTLDREYRVLTYLLQHAAGLSSQSVEDRILMIDYRLMRGWYLLTRTAAPEQARKALSERAAILGCFAQKMGEHAGLHYEA